MKLQRATSLNRLRGENQEEVGLFRSREERQERREERRERRAARKAARKEKRGDRRENRLERKSEKLRERQERLEEKAEQPTRRERRQARREDRQENRQERREERQERRSDRRGGTRVQAAVAPVPVRRREPGYPQGRGYPQDQGYPQDPGYIAPPDEYDDGSLVPEDEGPPMEEGEVDLEPAEPSTEGMGLSWPRRKTAPAPTPARSPVAPQVPATWSPPARMGTHLRIQASTGFRAAVVELRPGLFVVAEIPAEVARSELGFAPLIAPLMMRAASRAAARQNQAPVYTQQPDGTFVQIQQPERRGLLSVFRQPAQPVAQPVAALPGPAVQPQQAWSTAPTVVAPQPVQAAPVPSEYLADPPISGPLVVAVPRIARWADPQDVAGVLADPRFRGRR